MKPFLLTIAALFCYAVSNAQNNALAIDDFVTTVAVIGTDATINVAVTYEGEETVKDFDYTISSPAFEDETFHYILKEPLYKSRIPVFLNLPFKSGTIARMEDASITITKVNGVENEIGNDKNVSKGKLISIIADSPHKVVMEEFTATWCANCPRGIVAMEKLQRLYPDNFIGIAIHCDDVMSANGFNSLLKQVEAIPFCFVNRRYKCDPYWGYTYGGRFATKELFDVCLNQPTEAALQIRSAIWNEDSTSISITTDATFQYDNENAPYALGFVLTEDYVSGPGSKWNQANNLMTDLEFMPDEDFHKFYYGDSYIKNMEYMHVAVGGWKTGNGYEGSIQSPVVAGETQTFNKTLDISAVKQIQNKKNLKVIALLIDTERDRIVNADQTLISEEDVTAILPKTTDSTRKVESIYGIDGSRRNSLSRGVNIVRYSDGTTKTILKK